MSERKRRIVPAVIVCACAVDLAVAAPVSLFDLQPWRTTASLPLRSGDRDVGTITLANLNPCCNSWYTLSVRMAGRPDSAVYHLENPDPAEYHIGLDRAGNGLLLVGVGDTTACRLWNAQGVPDEIARAQKLPVSYAPLCDGRLYLRNPTRGSKSTMEWATDFLRTYVPGGEAITSKVKQTIYKDAHLTTSPLFAAGRKFAGAGGDSALGPPPAAVDSLRLDQLLVPEELGIEAVGREPGGLRVGRWYPVARSPGVFVSVIQPRLVAAEVVAAQKGRVSALDEVEASAMCYLVAFDLAGFDMSFTMGTEHPRVDWSDRVLPAVRVPGLPGPDGIGDLSPLVVTGMVPPYRAARVVAAFTGGFKRYHGAFRFGDLALRNRGSHYGFVENGVVLSRLHPGLVTLVVYNDGGVDMRTWTDADNAGLARVRHARQCGVPIIETDSGGVARPGALVKSLGHGNWSGSQEGRFRTLRAGAGIADRGGQRYLVYAYFSSATVSAMARVFQAYGCRYAMQTDMNALEHTYLAVYLRGKDGLEVQHLVRGMEVLDKKDKKGTVVPRFLGYSDNRDFFYLTRRGAVQ